MFRLPDYWPRTYILVFCASFIIAALAMPLAIILLRKLGIMDAVAENKIHQKPVPRGGGVVIFIAFVGAVLLPGYRSDAMNGILLVMFRSLCCENTESPIGGGSQTE